MIGSDQNLQFEDMALRSKRMLEIFTSKLEHVRDVLILLNVVCVNISAKYDLEAHLLITCWWTI